MSSAGANEDVRLTPEILCGDTVADPSMLGVRQADPILRKKCLLEMSGVEIRDVAERQIGLAGLQHSWGVGADLCRLDTNAGGNAADVSQDGRKQRDVASIRHADGKTALCGCRIEVGAKLGQ